MEKGVLEIEVLYERRDHWKTYFSYFFSFKSIYFSFLWYSAFAIVISVILLQKQIEGKDFVNAILFGLIFTFFISFVNTYFAVRNVERMNVRKCRYIFSDLNVEVIAESFTSKVDWNWFNRINETRNYFLIYGRGSQMYIVPKRFISLEQMPSIKELFRSKFGEKAYLKTSKDRLGLK